MHSPLLLQLLTSFLVGGLFIGLISLLAERASREVAGLVLSMPSTMVIAYFFLGLYLSPEAIKETVPAVPFALGGSYLFVASYVYMANAFRVKLWLNIFLSTSIGTLLWLLIALPLVIFEIRSFWLSLLGCIPLVSLSYYLLAIRPKHTTQPIEEHFTLLQIIARSIVAGCIIAFIVFISKVSGPLWGGVFSVFPAAMLSSILIVHTHRGPQFLFHVLRTMPLAAPTFILYALISGWAFPLYGVWIGTVIAYIGSGAYLVVVHRMIRIE